MMTPVCANYHYHLVMQFIAPKQPSNLTSEMLADNIAARVEETHHTLRMIKEVAQAHHTKYGCGKEDLNPVDYSYCTSSATTIVSVGNTQVFRTARTALTEPCTH